MKVWYDIGTDELILTGLSTFPYMVTGYDYWYSEKEIWFSIVAPQNMKGLIYIGEF